MSCTATFSTNWIQWTRKSGRPKSCWNPDAHYFLEFCTFGTT